MTPEYGASTQLEKIEMLGSADFIVLNKFEKPRSEDALRDITKQVRREKGLANSKFAHLSDEELPVFATVASRFNDSGVNALFDAIVSKLELTYDHDLLGKINKYPEKTGNYSTREIFIFVTSPILFVSTIHRFQQIGEKFKKYEALGEAIKILESKDEAIEKLNELKETIPEEAFLLIDEFYKNKENYSAGEIKYTVRGKEFSLPSKVTSLSGIDISKISLPNFSNLADLYLFLRESNIPGYFPYGAGIFPSKRTDEDPKRMFAGEGGPSRTNKRFHYLSADGPAKRLSTAFDSVTLYGEDPAVRPDIFGKIGEAGVSIATLDDMKTLFDGFDLKAPSTSVSMTINGPAPIILAMFMNTAIEQNLKGDDREDKTKCLEVMKIFKGELYKQIFLKKIRRKIHVYILWTSHYA